MLSESWHHVADERIRLRPTLEVRRQVFRGETWYVLRDPFQNRFVRFRPEVHDFVCRLHPSRTVGEVWNQCVEARPETAPGQQEVISLLAQLHQAGLLQSDLSPDSRHVLERRRAQQRRELLGRLASVLFIRIPLWDPEHFLRRTYPWVAPLFSRWFSAVWLVVVFFGIKAVVDHWNQALDRSMELLAPGNLPLLYLTFVAIKALHEFGHAYAVKKFGGEVHTIGIMLLVFNPVPFVDATAAWAFRERWKRVFVGMAGMIVELFVAAIAAMVWARSGDGTVKALAYNAMFIASVTTILFNVNPLMRFDGYYILSDLTDSPNLATRAVRQLYYWAERLLFGVRSAESPARSPAEAAWLGGYGIASWIYRLFVFTAILLFVATRFFGLGVVLAVVGGIAMFVVPVVRFVRYLAASPRLRGSRRRAMLVTAGIAGMGLLLLGVVPFPWHFRAPGVFRASARAAVAAGVDGHVRALPVSSVTGVDRGALLVELENAELDSVIASAEAELAQVETLQALALSEAPSSIAPLQKRHAAAARQLAKLRADREQLRVRAPFAGVWLSPRQDEFAGLWVRRGTPLGELIDPGAWEFAAVVAQQDAAAFFEEKVRGAEIRIPGEAGRPIPVGRVRIIPGRQTDLPSAALGWMAGGPVRLQEGDESGIRAAEPFFLVVGEVAASPPDAAGPTVVNRRTGVIRFELPPAPLLEQWSRSFKQMLQRRFGV